MAPQIRISNDVLPDGEMRLSLGDSVRGRAAYLVQSLCSPVGERLLELGLLADAARRAGAATITAVVPYLGYSRQERRSAEGQPLAAAVVAGMLSSCAIDRLVAVDLHAPSLEGFFGFPVEHLTAEPVLAAAIRPLIGRDGVVVAPDMGAVKLARRYAQRLDLPLAVVHKIRTSPSAVAVERLVGDVRGRRPVIVDDMISTGATIAAAREALLDAGAVPEIILAATHGVLAAGWQRNLAHPSIRHLLLTTSLEPPEDPEDERIQRVSLSPLLAEAIRRLHEGAPLHDLLAQT